MHPFRLPFPRRPRAPVTITARASRARPRRRALPGALRAVALGMLGVVAVAGAASGAWLLAGGEISIVRAALSLQSPGPLTAGQSSGAEPVAGGVPLRAASWPADAQVLVDGQALGTTPLVTAVLPGPHRVTLRHSGALEVTREVDVPAAGTALDVTLWRAQPTAVKLRPAYPGAAIADAQFLADGRITLVLLLPAGAGAVSGQPTLREAWLLDPASGRLDAFSPSIRAAALAVSPDSTRVAYLQQAPPPGQAGAGTPTSITGRLDEVWIAAQDDRQPLRRVFQLPPPERGSGYGTPPVEQLADLAWDPDGRRLLVATRIGDGATVSRARLLVLDTEDAGAAPRELITMPAEPVPGSYSWSADGSWVAFVARAAGAPAGKGLVTLVAAHLADDGAPGFRYLADLGRNDSSSAPPLPVTPVAWEPVTAADGPDARLLYTAPVATASGSGGLLDPVGLLGFRGQAEPPSGLFLTTPAAPDLAPDDRRRVGSAVGLVGPVWLPPAVGPAAGPVLALARTDDNGGQLVLRAVDLASGRAQETGSRLPPGLGSRSTPGVRWDAPHGQALLLARATTGSRGIATAGTSPDLDVWLVQFAQPQEPGA